MNLRPHPPSNIKEVLALIKSWNKDTPDEEPTGCLTLSPIPPLPPELEYSYEDPRYSDRSGIPW